MWIESNNIIAKTVNNCTNCLLTKPIMLNVEWTKFLGTSRTDLFFQNKFPQFGSVIIALNVSRWIAKPYWIEKSKQFDNLSNHRQKQSKHAPKKTPVTIVQLIPKLNAFHGLKRTEKKQFQNIWKVHLQALFAKMWLSSATPRTYSLTEKNWMYHMEKLKAYCSIWISVLI